MAAPILAELVDDVMRGLPGDSVGQRLVLLQDVLADADAAPHPEQAMERHVRRRAARPLPALGELRCSERADRRAAHDAPWVITSQLDSTKT